MDGTADTSATCGNAFAALAPLSDHYDLMNSKRSIDNLIRDCATKETTADCRILYDRLCDHFSDDGKTLFNYYASSCLDPILDSSPRNLEQLRRQNNFWEHVRSEEKEIWAKATRSLKNSLLDRQPAALNILHIGSSTANVKSRTEGVWQAALVDAARLGDAEYALFILKAYSNHWNELDPNASPVALVKARFKEEPKVKSVEKKVVSETPIADALLGQPLSQAMEQYPETWVDKVVASIEDRLTINPTDTNIPRPFLRGRISNVQINYDPAMIPDEESHIIPRLKTAQSRGLTSNTKYDSASCEHTIEWLLRPLLYWHRHTDIFKDIKGAKNPQSKLFPPEEKRRYTNFFESCLTWDDPSERAIRSCNRYSFIETTHENKELVVSTLMDSLRAHILKFAQKPYIDGRARTMLESLQRQRQRSREDSWDVVSPEGGFTKRLEQCFDREGLRPEEYLDLLEQQFFALNYSFRTASKLHEARGWEDACK